MTSATTPRMGRPKNSSSPPDRRADAGPARLQDPAASPARPATAAPARPPGWTPRRPATTASWPAQPNPSHWCWSAPAGRPADRGARGHHRGLRETTSPVTLAPLHSSTRPLNTTDVPSTRPEMVTGASKAVSDPLTVPSTVDRAVKHDQVTDLLTLGAHRDPAGEDDERPRWSGRLQAHAGAARPSMRGAKKFDNQPSAGARQSPPMLSACLLGQCGQLNTNRHDKPWSVITIRSRIQTALLLRPCPFEVIYRASR